MTHKRSGSHKTCQEHVEVIFHTQNQMKELRNYILPAKKKNAA